METADTYADHAEARIVAAQEARDADTGRTLLMEAQVWATLAQAAAVLDAAAIPH